MELKIEKLIYGGDGLARVVDEASGRAKAVFVPFVAPGEKIEATVKEQKPSFARAVLDEIIEPSPARREPPCPYFGRCGGCHYQHLEYAEQVRVKAEILQETLARTAKITLDQPIQTHSAEPLNYRNRTRMRVAHAPEFAVGYYRHGSHTLLPVNECPISSPLINRALAALWELGRAGKVPRTVREIQFFANHDDAEMLVEWYVDHGVAPETLRPAIEQLRLRMPEIIGCAVFQGAPADDQEDQRAPLTRAKSAPGTFIGAQLMEYRTGGHAYQVRAGSFFQVNRFLVDELIEVVTANRKGNLALDFYSGGGLFSLPLAERFTKVVSVEASGHSFADLKANAPENVKAVRASAEEFMRNEGRRVAADLVVLDPPRAGLGERAAQLLGRMSVPRVTYVSCDPATLSRDMRVLADCGFRVEEAHLFDLFPQTYHLESVLHLAR